LRFWFAPVDRYLFTTTRDVTEIMKLNVYGREIEISRSEKGWDVFYLGNEGKKRKADDIKIPAATQEDDIITLVADICHEWARPNHHAVTKINEQ